MSLSWRDCITGSFFETRLQDVNHRHDDHPDDDDPPPSSEMLSFLPWHQEMPWKDKPDESSNLQERRLQEEHAGAHESNYFHITLISRRECKILAAISKEPFRKEASTNKKKHRPTKKKHWRKRKKYDWIEYISHKISCILEIASSSLWKHILRESDSRLPKVFPSAETDTFFTDSTTFSGKTFCLIRDETCVSPLRLSNGTSIKSARCLSGNHVYQEIMSIKKSCLSRNHVCQGIMSIKKSYLSW